MAQGLREIYLAIRPELLRFLAARRADADAEDIVQELFLKLDGAPSAPIANPRAYLYRMADNLLLDRRRAARRRAAREEAWTDTQGGIRPDVDGGPDSERTLMARERLAALERALAGLPERTAAVFRRFRLDNIPQRDIAHEFGISLSAIEKHLQRAYRVVLDAQAALDAESHSPQRLGGGKGHDGD